MDSPPTCPDEPSWRRLLSDDVEGPERDALEVHLDDCEPCRERLALLAEWPSALVIPVGWAAVKSSRSSPGEGKPDRPVVGEGGIVLARTPELQGFDEFVEVGRGGMGIVYRARQVGLDRPVAIKILSAAGRLAAGGQSRAIREARALGRLDHPHIVRVHEVGEFDELPYLVMEWVEGGDLAKRLAQGPLPPREAATLALGLAQAVTAAHERGIIHRDIKPRNILIAADGSPRLTDFGLARDLDSAERLTSTGLALGTPGYMAPEQVDPAFGPVGPPADVHAIGATLYAMLTGHPPFRAPSDGELFRQIIEREPIPPRRLDEAIPRDLDTICRKCLEKRPARRYDSAEALAEDLGRFLDGRPIRAQATGPIGALVRQARRRPVTAALGASVVLLLLGFALGGVLVARAQARLREIAEANADHSRRALQASSRGLEASAAALRTMHNSPRPEVRALFAQHLDDVAGNYERYFRDRPRDPAWIAGEVRMCGFLAELKDLQGRPDDAVGLRHRCVEAGLPLLAADPADIDLRLLVIDSASRVAVAIGKGGDTEECLAGFERAYQIAEAIGLDDIDHPNAFYIRSMAAANLAMTYRWLGRPGDAAKIRERGLEFARKARARRPGDPVVAAMMIEHLTGLASTRIESGRPEEATPPLDDADSLLATLADSGPTTPARDMTALRDQIREVRDRLPSGPRAR